MKNRILIVEDEYIYAIYLKTLLTGAGYEIIDIVPSGELAIKKSEELKPDVILMDIKLDGKIDGITAVKEIQKKSDLPVIYVTALSDEETYNLASSTKMYGFINKPVDEDKLFECIKNICLN